MSGPLCEAPTIVYTAGFAYTGKTVLARRIARLLSCPLIEVSDLVRAAVRERTQAKDRTTLQRSNELFDDPDWLVRRLRRAVQDSLAKGRRVVVSGPRESKLVLMMNELATTYGIWVWTETLERVRRAKIRDGLDVSIEQLMEIDGRDLDLGVGTIERMCAAAVDSSGHPVETSIALERVLVRLGLLDVRVGAIGATPVARVRIVAQTSETRYRTLRVGPEVWWGPRWWRRLARWLLRWAQVPLTVRAADILIQMLIAARVYMAKVRDRQEKKGDS